MTTALYRRYRPDSFEQVIGQEHVTVPLANAIDKHRINHAYLFSGPRGCGKTTSARILARCLNCAQGPTATPCGQCDSCTDLATGGSGSLDVIEIDAASHGGVDDARDLRERATFAPTRDRYKVFIIDEAHMVTPAGFNALLKIVEEPPEHIKFIFATTEPDKVIGTIRSRTHHYPFRLVPPEPLMQYLETLAGYEQIPIAPGVLSLVIRAGGGSVRDTLSVLDQLLAGATQEGVSYDLAVNLLGFTPENLLDDVVNALAAEDSPTVFRVVDQVVQSGQDPERFVQDLLERFRDVVIVRAAPEQAAGILHGMPEDQLRRLGAQAQQLGAAEVSRAADITAAALTQMNGATSPRLHLELLMARLMLPATDETERGLAARMDRLERRIEYGGVPEASAGNPQPRQPAPQAAAPAEETGLSGAAAARAALLREREAEEASEEQSAVEPQQPAAQPQPAPRPERQPEPQARPEPTPEPQQAEPVNDQPAQPVQSNVPEVAVPPQAPATPEQPTEQRAAQQPSQVEMARRAWPEVLEFLKNESRLIWMTVNGNAQVVGFDGKLLTIGFDNDGARNTVQMRGGANLLSAGFNHVLGIQPELDLISGTSDGGSPKGSSRPARQQPQPARQRPQAPPEQPPAAQQQRPTQKPAQPASPVARQNAADTRPQASAQPSSPQPPQQPAQPPQQSQQRPAPQSAPQPAPIHPQPPATGVAGWGTGQPDQAWGQPEPDWGEPDPNWGP
ncbi:MAG: DNA polymerase III subunit gamma and tau, partial [Yaniella sp.]